MEANDLEEYVRQRWEHVELCHHQIVYWVIIGSEHLCSRTALENRGSESGAWQAAYDFTIAREEQIGLVEEERTMLAGKILLEDKDMAAMKRVLAREQAALDELKRGMKEGGMRQ